MQHCRCHSMLFTVTTHSDNIVLLTVTILSCSLQLPLLDLTCHYHCHYLSLWLPLPLDGPVLIDAKEESLLHLTCLPGHHHYNQPMQAVCCSPSSPPLGLPWQCQQRLIDCRLVRMCKEFSCGTLWQKGTKRPATTECTHSVQIPAVTKNLQYTQVHTITVNLQYREAQETFYLRHLVLSQ